MWSRLEDFGFFSLLGGLAAGSVEDEGDSQVRRLLLDAESECGEDARGQEWDGVVGMGKWE